MNALTEILRWDPYLVTDEDDMNFRLTYAGRLLSHTRDRRLPERSLHVHELRRHFHKQLRELWSCHPVLANYNEMGQAGQPMNVEPTNLEGVYSGEKVQGFVGKFPTLFDREGFQWLPIVTKEIGLICQLEILLLRYGSPGQVVYDIDNRIKTVLDALKIPSGKQELGEGTTTGLQQPNRGETPFYVLMEDDGLITHLSVTSDQLLEEVCGVPRDQAARLVIEVTIRPYQVHMENLEFT